MRYLGFMFVSCVFPLVLVADEPKTTLDKKKIVDATTEIQKRNDEEIYFAKLALQNLSVGSRATLNVTLKNPFDQEIKFSGVSSKCACSQFKMRNSSVPANGETRIAFDIEIPPRHRQKTVEADVSIVEKGTSVIRLELTYGLDGLMAFKELISIVRFDDVDEAQKELVVPFLVTNPVKAADVKAYTSDNLKSVSVAVVERGDQGPAVKLTIPDSVVSKGNVRGELYLSHKETKQIDSYLLTIKDSRTSEIGPSITKFRRQNGKWTATAIVKIAGGRDAEGQTRSPIECRLGEQILDVAVKKLKGNTYRATITAAESAFANLGSEDADKLTWRLFNGAKHFTIKTEFIRNP